MSVSDTFPWLTGNRKQIGAVDRPSAHALEGGGRQLRPHSDREKTPQPTPVAAPVAPRGSPIANKLGRHASHAWTSIPIPHQAIQVRTPSPPSVEKAPPPASFPAPPASFQTRPPYGSSVSHRRRLEPRAGSPAYWAPRLAVHPSVHESPGVTWASCHSDPPAEQGPHDPTTQPFPLSTGSRMPDVVNSLPTAYTRAGEEH